MTAVGTIVCARMSSVRLPGKAMLPLGGVPMLQFLLERLHGPRKGDVIFATTERADDDVLSDCAASLGIPVFRGSELNVADRCLQAARQFGFDWLVRVTGDCPFVDAESLHHCLAQWQPQDAIDLYSTKGVFPVGIDYELLSTATLARACADMTPDEQEHVTLRFYRPELGFVVKRFARPASWPVPDNSYLVDTEEDYRKAVAWRDRLGNNCFSVQELLELAPA